MSDKSTVLDALIRTAVAIADTFDPVCETLVRDMQQPGHPIIEIYNGHISERLPGSTEDIFGEDETKAPDSVASEEDIIKMPAITKNHRMVKSTSINFKGEDYHYVLGINFDYTEIKNFNTFLTYMSAVSDEISNHTKSEMDSYNLKAIFSSCVNLIGIPISSMNKKERVKLIKLLQQHNAFSFQKSVAYVAEQLDVTRCTVYKYCKEAENLDDWRSDS